MSVVVAEKNHEQYLEQIEKAVANTTMDILEKHSGDLRAMAKLVAEKQVEINRLKEFQDNDRKTIRSLRLKLKEAVDEIECRCSTWDTKEKEYEAEIAELKPRAYEFRRMADDYDNLSLAYQLTKEENEQVKSLKEEVELQRDYIDAIPDKVEEYKDELHAVMGENRMLKEKIQSSTIAEARSARDKALQEIKELKKELEEKEEEVSLINGEEMENEEKIALLENENEKLKERLDEAWSEYNTEHEMRDTAEKELEELKDEQELMMLQGIHKVKELEKEIEELKEQLEDDTRQVHTLFAENEKLKEELKKV